MKKCLLALMLILLSGVLSYGGDLYYCCAKDCTGPVVPKPFKVSFEEGGVPPSWLCRDRVKSACGGEGYLCTKQQACKQLLPGASGAYCEGMAIS